MAELDAVVDHYIQVCGQLRCPPNKTYLSVLENGGEEFCDKASKHSGKQLYALAATIGDSKIKKLRINGVTASNELWGTIVRAASRAPALQELYLTDCSFNAMGTVTSAKLGSLLGDMQLTRLDLSGTMLDQELFEELAYGKLLRWRGLQHIALAGCGITDDLLRCMMAGIGSKSVQVKTLSLGYNKLTDHGALDLSKLISGTNAWPLEALHLQYNQISDMGGQLIGKALRKVVGLEHLDLSGNPISDGTIASIIAAWRLNPGTVKELLLADTAEAGGGVTMDGVLLLLQAASHHATINMLDIRGIRLSTMLVVHSLCQLIKHSRSLRELHVDLLSSELVPDVVAALRHSTTMTQLSLGVQVPAQQLSAMHSVLDGNSGVEKKARENGWVTKLEIEGTPRSSGSSPKGWTDDRMKKKNPFPTSSSSIASEDTRPTTPSTVDSSGFASSNALTYRQPWTPARSVTSAKSSTFTSKGSKPLSSSVTLGPSPEALLVHRSLSCSLSLNGSVGGHSTKSDSGAASSKSEIAPAVAFRKHDLDKDLQLQEAELMLAMADTGVLKGLNPVALGKYLGEEVHVRRAHDGYVSLMEFMRYYHHIVSWVQRTSQQQRTRTTPPVPSGARLNKALRQKFLLYCDSKDGEVDRFLGKEMNMHVEQFRRLCSEHGLMTPVGRLNVWMVDLIFVQCKTERGRRMGWSHFLQAVACIAQALNKNFDSVVRVFTVAGTQFTPAIEPHHNSIRPSGEDLEGDATEPAAADTRKPAAKQESDVFVLKPSQVDNTPTFETAGLIPTAETPTFGTLSRQNSWQSQESYISLDVDRGAAVKAQDTSVLTPLEHNLPPVRTRPTAGGHSSQSNTPAGRPPTTTNAGKASTGSIASFRASLNGGTTGASPSRGRSTATKPATGSGKTATSRSTPTAAGRTAAGRTTRDPSPVRPASRTTSRDPSPARPIPRTTTRQPSPARPTTRTTTREPSPARQPLGRVSTPVAKTQTTTAKTPTAAAKGPSPRLKTSRASDGEQGTAAARGPNEILAAKLARLSRGTKAQPGAAAKTADAVQEVTKPVGKMSSGEIPSTSAVTRSSSLGRSASLGRTASPTPATKKTTTGVPRVASMSKLASTSTNNPSSARSSNPSSARAAGSPSPARGGTRGTNPRSSADASSSFSLSTAARAAARSRATPNTTAATAAKEAKTAASNVSRTGTAKASGPLLTKLSTSSIKSGGASAKSTSSVKSGRGPLREPAQTRSSLLRAKMHQQGGMSSSVSSLGTAVAAR